MSEPLFQKCSICEGHGSVRHDRFPHEQMRSLNPLPGSMFERFECPGCAGVCFVPIGLTSGQVEGIVAENERLRARVQVPLAAVIIPSRGSMAIELHVCDLPGTARELSLAFMAQGRMPHTVHRVTTYHVHATGKGEVSDGPV